MRLPLLFLALSASLPSDIDLPRATVPFPRVIRPPPKRVLGVLAVECPRCHAGVGENCDRRTLGRHFHHMARVEAHEAVKA